MYDPRIELRHLRYFVAVAQELHFSRAAEKLHIAQPPLSQQIRQLEQIVGAPLFERNHHTVTLTNAGQVFLQEVLPILEQVEFALVRAQRAQQGLIGKLSIGYIRHAPGADTFLPAVIALYRQRYPGVNVSLREIQLHEQQTLLREQHIQLGFTINIKSQHVPTEFAAEVVQRLPIVTVCAPQHRFASQPSVTLHELANEPFVSCAREVTGAFHDHIMQLCGFIPHIVQEVSDVSMVLGLVAANFGIALFPTSTMLLQHPGVVICPFEPSNTAMAFETSLIWRKHETSSPAQAFLAIAREIL